MLIYSMKPGHDGSVAVVDGASQQLLLAYEAEKDSYPRYHPFNPVNMMEAAMRLDRFPDVFAVSGWTKTGPGPNVPVAAGYYDVGPGGSQVARASVFGQMTTVYSSSHARSHIWSCYGMSPYDQGQPCYALIWEGAFGDFYEIDENLEVSHLGHVMKTPGNKYAFLYALADPMFIQPSGPPRFGDAGKLMALCGFGAPGIPDRQERELIDTVLAVDPPIHGDPLGRANGNGNGHGGPKRLQKDSFRHSPYHNIGLQSPEFTRLARRFSDELFARFESFARENLTKGYPLLISGGCGLNCDWNSAWKDSGIFADVFVPPCVNDTGSAIGTAVDAMRELTGKAKLSWSVYSGQEFVDDEPYMPDVVVRPLDVREVAAYLADDHVVAWTNGRCEIGPRALGNRSLLAAPFDEAMHARLNRIKEREGFRPIAPICLEEDVSTHFEWSGPSPYMLHFQRVRDGRLRAVTHVDNTVRAQTVREDQNAPMNALLRAFRDRTGVGVLCNTSLNFNGGGFINRTSDLYSYCKDRGIDAFVYDGKFCTIG